MPKYDTVLVVQNKYYATGHVTTSMSTNATHPHLIAHPADGLPPDDGLHCSRGDLLGPLGLFVQGLLAFIAFASLIVKRFCEPRRQRRPWKIWFFDTSKQAIGAAVIHFANVFLADMFQGDPCTWYFISFLLDSTVGLLVIYIGLRICQCVVRYRKQDSLMFGDYGHPAQCTAWMGQCALYILVMCIEKLTMTLLVLLSFWRDVRRFIMSPIKDPNLELILVIFIVPFIVNAIIFWVVDNFLKKKVFSSKPTNVSLVAEDDAAIKYRNGSDKISYHNRLASRNDSESDELLSLDGDFEAVDLRRRDVSSSVELDMSAEDHTEENLLLAT